MEPTSIAANADAASRREIARAFATMATGEAYAVAQLLPVCPICGGLHPLARRPAIDSAYCPDCGTRHRDLPQPVLVTAALVGSMGRLGRMFFRAAAVAARLASRIQP